jgi:type I restriction enzyme R subunit
MTGSASDLLDWQEHIRNKDRRKAIGNRLKDPKDSLRLIIVRDMFRPASMRPACTPCTWISP